jgi:hypothetical protein
MMSTTQKEFYFKRYDTLNQEVNRIKEDEQRWVSVLLLIYGAIFAYNNTLEHTDFNFGTVLLWSTFTLSCYWIFHATTLRVQYYRRRIQIGNVERKLRVEVSFPTRINWWRHTKPLESKFSEVCLCTLLFVGANYIMLYKVDKEFEFFYRHTFIVWSCALLLFALWLSIDLIRLRNSNLK